MVSRRDVLKTSAQSAAGQSPHMMSMKLHVNGGDHALELDTRTSLLDALREHLHLTGSKKG